MAKERELQVDDVEPPGAQDPVQGPLQRWHRDPQPLEAAGRGQGPQLQQPLGEAVPTVGVGDQHHLAAVGLHGPAALLNIELVVDQHHRRQVVASRQLGHQPMHPRLGAKARRAGRHLGNVEDTEALWAHRYGCGSPVRSGRRHDIFKQHVNAYHVTRRRAARHGTVVRRTIPC